MAQHKTTTDRHTVHVGLHSTVARLARYTGLNPITSPRFTSYRRHCFTKWLLPRVGLIVHGRAGLAGLWCICDSVCDDYVTVCVMTMWQCVWGLWDRAWKVTTRRHHGNDRGQPGLSCILHYQHKGALNDWTWSHIRELLWKIHYASSITGIAA